VNKGFVECASLLGVSGWAVSGAGERPAPVVQVWIGGELIGLAVSRQFRGDVKDAGESRDGRCGFSFVFPERVSADQMKTLRVTFEDGAPLPVIGPRSFDIYELLFDGSFGRDTSLPFLAFLSTHYLRHNARRLEHLASLRLPLHGKTVVEFGAGVGDHTSFYLDRGCTVLATDARTENLGLLKTRFLHHPNRDRISTRIVNVEEPFEIGSQFDIVHCYGLLYHIANAREAIRGMARHCKELLVLETKCNPADGIDETHGEEESTERYHSFSGKNFRPTRGWLHEALKAEFPYVYWPRTQPAHQEFAVDFHDLRGVEDGWPRAIVVASRVPLVNDMLVTSPPQQYQQS
jgi:SAM-dependent methyltransferase